MLVIFVRTVLAHLRRVAKRELGLDGTSDAHPGAICFLQRFGSALNLNPHLHVSATDGVFVEMDDNEKPRFRALPSPTRAEIAAVAWQTCEETVALLRQRGQWIDASPEEADRLAQDEPLLAACYSASLLGTIATGPSAGRRLMRLYGAAARDPDDEKPPKNAYGFDVHAGVRTPARDRKRLERPAQLPAAPGVV